MLLYITIEAPYARTRDATQKPGKGQAFSLAYSQLSGRRVRFDGDWHASVRGSRV